MEHICFAGVYLSLLYAISHEPLTIRNELHNGGKSLAALLSGFSMQSSITANY